MNRACPTILLLASLFIICCQQPAEIVPDIYQPRNLHEQYTLSLENTGLSKTAIGQAWIDAGEHALQSPARIKAPYEEEFYVLADQVAAHAYQVEGAKGHKIQVTLEQTAGDSTLLFLDAYRVSADSLEAPNLIATANESEQRLAFEVVENGSFVIRFQNELLRKGQFKIKIIKVPSLDFPVAGGKTYDIGSLFGVDRDAGRRRHEGIDIFARRHTPIIAPTDGNINWAGDRTGSLGGKVIWMRDVKRNQTLYFAHLQDVFVTKGDKVTKGDTIGSVGNSGNAVTTAPHLHFGIYQDGAIDPYNHVVTLKTRPSKILGDKEYLGQVLRTKRSTRLKSYDSKEIKTTVLAKHQLLRVVGVVANNYKVSLPDGKEGLIFYDDVIAVDKSIRKVTCEKNSLLDAPMAKAIVLNTIANQEVEVIGYSGSKYQYVKTENGQRGWILI